MDKCITYGRKVPDVEFAPLVGFVDSSWGDSPDDRRSTTGYIYMSWGGPISWSSKKQASVSLSSCEAEYYACAEAAKEAIWVKRLFTVDFRYDDLSVITLGDLSEREYQGDKPLTIRCDNQGAIQLSRNPVSHKRSKHIEIRYHFVRERVQDGTLKFTYVDTKLNISGILTKPTSKPVFTFLRDKLLWDRDPSAVG